MRISIAVLASIVIALTATAAQPASRLAPASSSAHEAYLAVPMPPGIHVEATELDGPVFADAAGHTLYIWPFKAMRHGVTGDPEGKSFCETHVETDDGGFMSPSPPGLTMPDVDTRPTCTQMWPPVAAEDTAQPVGNWSLIL